MRGMRRADPADQAPRCPLVQCALWPKELESEDRAEEGCEGRAAALRGVRQGLYAEEDQHRPLVLPPMQHSLSP